MFIIFLTEILTGQNVDFRFDPDSESQAKTVTSYSSFWLSRTPPFSPYGAKRLLVSAGYSAPLKRLDGETWILPDADLAVKVTNNLALSGKVYGFSTEKDQPQVVGAGVQYFFGNEEEKSWVFTVQRADLKGLYSFRIKSFTFDIRKWMPWSIILIRNGGADQLYCCGCNAGYFRYHGRIRAQVSSGSNLSILFSPKGYLTCRNRFQFLDLQVQSA